MNSERLPAFIPHMLAVLRVVTALLFMQHGLQKLFGFPPGGFESGPLVLWSLTGIAGILETFGGFAILIGFCTRPVAFILSGEMAVAYFLIHLTGSLGKPMGFFPVVNGGDLAILFSFVFLFFFVSGPGSFSIDGWKSVLAQPTAPPTSA